MRRDIGSSRFQVSECELQNIGLIELKIMLNKSGRSLRDYPPMPLPSSHSIDLTMNRLIREELEYDQMAEKHMFEELHSKLNEDQLRAFDEIFGCYENRSGGLYFVCGSCGTGKTYLWRTLISKLRSERKIVLSVASSGITALLLPGGRTSHSRFKIPINIHELSSCSITCNSDLAAVIREASMVLWDEAPMMHRHGFEAVNRTLQDIMKHTHNSDEGSVFGGKIFVLGGDFRQTLPVVPKGRREATVLATITQSGLWNHCKVLHLKTNMRILCPNLTNSERHLSNFAKWVLSIGEGKVHSISLSELGERNWVKIPDGYLIKNDDHALQNLIESTYPYLINSYNGTAYLKDRAILAPKNSDVDRLNEIMLSMIPGVARKYMSADSICQNEERDIEHTINPPEYLNSLDFPGIPSHYLHLKEGTPVILLRNLNQSEGLCNGTRLQIVRMGDKVLEAKILTGSNVVELVLNPRITLTPQSIHTPFPLKRRQFPLKVAFAMTINKSQGQTLKSVGVYLSNPVFSHGQLYVANPVLLHRLALRC